MISVLKFVLLLNLLLVDGFAPVSVSSPSNDVRLFMAGKRGQAPKAAGRVTKNKKNNPKQNKKTGASKTKPASGSSSRAAQMNNKKKPTNFAPPWQIVSTKDMAKNTKAEKERRKLAQEGIHDVEDDREYRISKSFLSLEDKAILAWKRFSMSPSDKVDFVGAYLNEQLPPRLGAPEIAFLGRSNVGKSSLLNKIVTGGAQSKSVARVGRTPGATASVNLYGIFRKDKALLGLVDLPGFGYAKLSKESKESVQIAAEKYLGKRKELALGILLVDIRREPSEEDRAVLAALYDMGVPIVVVATKMDKIAKTQLDGALETIRDGLGLPEGQPLCVSSATGAGLKDIWRIILEACEGMVDEFGRKLESGGSDEDRQEVFEEEGEEIAYSQGYDWIHDSSSVMYEGDAGDFVEAADAEEDEVVQEIDITMRKESIKDLRKRALEMELRGEL
jgi:GTP-binding protein